MAIKFKFIEEGMTLWSKQRQGMGNTTMTREAWFEVRIIKKEECGATVSWNGNRHRHYSIRQLEKLYRKRPEPKK